MTFEDDLLALERRVLEQAGGDFFRAVADLRRMLAADSGGVGRRLEELAVPALQEAAVQGALDGWTLGGQRAITAAETALRVDPNALGDADLRLLTPPAHLTDPFTGLDALLADAKTRSVALLRSGADAETAASPVFQAATTARARIVTQVNAASNAAAAEVGDATRSPMVWEAERDACVFCLALAGEVVEQAGDLFPAPDLYAPPPSSMSTTSTPPLHPHCRCRLALLVSREYADALKREAQRSILRGHSLASESQAVRVRAAARLLERDPVAPKTVKVFAAAAVKRGHFLTRDVPEGDPRLIIDRAPPKAPPRPSPSPRTPPKAPEVVVTPPASPTVIRTAAEAKAWGERMPDSLTLAPHAKETLTLYSGRGAYEVNRGLRQGALRPSAKPIADGMDDLMTRSSVHEDVVVTRALDADAFGGLEGLQKLVGGVFSDKGFLSTSLSDKPLGTLTMKQVRMSITVPKGTPAIYVGKASQFKAERELLLDRGTRLAIESATYNARSGAWEVKATVVPKPAKSGTGRGSSK